MEFVVKNKKIRGEKPKVFASVGKSVFKRAVERNLLKRRLRAVLLPIARANKTDVSVYVRGKAERIDFAKLKTRVINSIK